MMQHSLVDFTVVLFSLISLGTKWALIFIESLKLTAIYNSENKVTK